MSKTNTLTLLKQVCKTEENDLFNPKMSNMTHQNSNMSQFFAKNSEAQRHLSTFTAENTAKSVSFKIENCASKLT